ncbi:MAG TPA: vWA domain-containing protein [Phytomonospora sp.]
MPSITPNTPGVAAYTINGSKAFVVNSIVDFNNIARTFTVTYPDPAPAGLSIELRRVTAPAGSVDLDALADGVVDSTSISGRDVSVIRFTGGGTTQLTCNFQDPSEAGVLNEHYELRVRADAPVNWSYSVDNAFNSTVVRLVCDPVATFNGLTPNLLEQQLLTLTADDAVGPIAAPTVVRATTGDLVLPAPSPTYEFGHTGLIAIIGLPSDPLASQTYQLVDPSLTPAPLPGVYGPTPVPMTVDVVHGGITPDDPDFLSARGTFNTTIEARPQRAVLVLDRSGSMAVENRWDNAKTAARIFVNLFGEFRNNVDPQDAIGITVFDDSACVFRDPRPPVNGTVDPLITAVEGLDKPEQVAANIGSTVFGNPGGCTPIGDGLAFGLQILQNGGLPADARYTVVLLTDGDENAGTVKIGPGADPANPMTWAQRIAPSALPAIPDINPIATHPDLNLFTIGLGSAPNNTVLNSLVAKGHFAAAVTVGELIDRFTTMLKISQEINKLTPRYTQDPNAPQPLPPQNEVFFTTTSADKFGVAVLRDITVSPVTPTTVEIARWNGSSFVVEPIPVQTFEGHHYIGVPNASAFGAGSQTWRVRRLNAGVPEPLTVTPASSDVIAFEDLHVKSALTLDQKDYRTGDDMNLAVRIRHDFARLPGATVRAVLDAPDGGLGGMLADLDADDIDRNNRKIRSPKDRSRGRAALIEALLAKHDWHHLPRCNPGDGGGLFVDGTDILHDVDGDGTYTNTFARVNADGVYNWTLFVEGVDTAGNFFSQRLDQSTLAVIGVSSHTSIIRKETLRDAPPGMKAVKVTVTPLDKFKNRLGPGFDDTVIWAVRDGGVFAHVKEQKPPPVNTDGTYTRTVVFRAGAFPTLKVSVNGVTLPKIYVRQKGHDDKDDR